MCPTFSIIEGLLLINVQHYYIYILEVLKTLHVHLEPPQHTCDAKFPGLHRGRDHKKRRCLQAKKMNCAPLLFSVAWGRPDYLESADWHNAPLEEQQVCERIRARLSSSDVCRKRCLFVGRVPKVRQSIWEDLHRTLPGQLLFKSHLFPMILPFHHRVSGFQASSRGRPTRSRLQKPVHSERKRNKMDSAFFILPVLVLVLNICWKYCDCFAPLICES